METLASRMLDVTIDDNDNPITGLQKEPLVSFEAALWHWQKLSPAALDVNDIGMAVDCAVRAAKKRKAKEPSDPLTLDQIAAIHIYTQECPVYVVLNANMRNRDRTALKPAFPYLKLFLTALYSLTPISGVVFRGIRKDLSAKFKDGTEHMWWAFSSTTRKVNVLENPMFLGTEGARTLLNIAATTAYDISMYSAIDGEQELLLPPGTMLSVEGNLSPAKDLYIVQMKQQPYRPLFTMDTNGGAVFAAAPPHGFGSSQPSPAPAKGPAPSFPKGIVPPPPSKKGFPPPPAPSTAAASWAETETVSAPSELEEAMEDVRKGVDVVNLNGAGIGDAGVCALVDFLLETSTALTTLRLDGNGISEEGARALAKYLSTSTSLTLLDLSKNSIGAEGARALGLALQTNTSLETLRLGSNGIGDEGAKALAESLKTNSRLADLGLTINSIRDDGALALAESLNSNKALTSLDLDHNSIDAAARKVLQKVARRRGRLTLYVDGVNRPTKASSSECMCA